MRAVLRRLVSTWGLLSATLLAALLGLVGLEVLARALSTPPQEGPRATADAFAEQPEAEAMLAEIYSGRITTQFAPFVHYRLGPHPGPHVTIDEEGHRVVPGTRSSTTGPTVWMFGGSTMWGMGARDTATIPAWLAAKLGPEVRVESFAQVGYMSTQEVLTLLMQLQTRSPPDVVVFYDGVNEVLPALKLGRVGVSLDVPRRQAEFNITRPGELGRLLRAALRGLAKESKLVTWVLGPTPSAPAITASNPDEVAARIIETYAANVRTLVGMGQTFGFRTCLYWQPTVFSKRRRSPGEEKEAQARADFRPLYEAAQARLHSRGPEPVTDLSDAFGDDPAPAFFDFCHVAEAGNRRLAELMLPCVQGALNP